MGGLNDLFFCAFAVVIPAWGLGAYAMIRAWITRPTGVHVVPLFSNDPKVITAEGRKWRRVFFVCAGVFGATGIVVL